MPPFEAAPFIRRSHVQRLVINALLTAHDEGHEIYGNVISKATGANRSAVIGVLRRLDESGWTSSRIDDRAQRRYYRLTDQGAQAARAWLGRT